MTSNNSTASLAAEPPADLQPVMVVGSTARLGSFFFPHWVRGPELIARTTLVCPKWARASFMETKDETGRVVEISCNPPCYFVCRAERTRSDTPAEH